MNTQTFQPTTLQDFAFSSPKTENTLKGIVNRTIPFPCDGTSGILLYGVFGTGKTTLARLLPELIEQAHGGTSASYEYVSCEQGKRGSELMKEINKIADYQCLTHCGHHFVVLDEVDNLSAEAQNSLKGVMNRRGVLFVMTTNHITKINQGVQDRCYVLEMNKPLVSQCVSLIEQMAARAGWHTATTNDLQQIALLSKGSLRCMSREVHLNASNANINNP
jgi:replication-associated recombination protein RarA